ncbi:hypothetical protein [Amycolatopsis anabasis]|uniref:hypothetical protein n=1 Tax=Amycolatopsis anabasis TaxID=1840409 RepID=UPI00131BE156|nr:hypothetical protein [Amycolatopsis anabasis]
MIRPILTGVLVAAASACALTGCGSDTPPAPARPTAPSAVASPESTAWADRVCQAVQAQAATLGSLPMLDSPDPRQVKQAMVSYLDGLSRAFASLVDGVEKAGPPPVTDGVRLVEKTTGILRNTKQAIDNAKPQAEGAPADQPARFQEVMGKISADLTNLRNMDDPMKDLKAADGLKAGFAESATCQRLDGGS